jgi:pectate lyase
MIVILETFAGSISFAIDHAKITRRSDPWFRSDEGVSVVRNILSHQSMLGDWPKNLDTSAVRFSGDRSKIRGTFDNGASVGELRILARAAVANAETSDAARIAFLQGLDHVLAAQYPNGGWPQSYPPGSGYARYITFNDNTMINLMELIRDAATASEFEFIDGARRDRCREAFDRGLSCILAARIRTASGRTVWCAQHDEATLEPRPARAFEPASASGAESARILRLLMSLEHPTDQVRAAIEEGAAWFARSALVGVREVRVDGDKRMIDDPSAPPLWARFYDLETNRPIYRGRDGIDRASIAEIEAERRNGYAWHGEWGKGVASEYARWRKTRGREPLGRGPRL